MIPTTTILVANGSSQKDAWADFTHLADSFAAQLGQPVIPCALDEGQQPLLSALSQALREGAVRLVIIPLFLSPAAYKSNAIAEFITQASGRWPFLQFHLSPPITWEAWVRLFKQFDWGEFDKLAESGLILAFENDDPPINSDMCKLARLVYEAAPFRWVEPAFVGENGRPALPVVLDRMKAFGTEKLTVLPWVLFSGMALTQIKATMQEDIDAALGPHLAAQPTLLGLLQEQHEMALADRSLLPVSWEEVERQLAAEVNTHDKLKPGQNAPDEDEYQQLQAKINAILPPRYQDSLDMVSPAPMPAADLVFDSEGRIAWNEIFGVDDPDNPFCELALAGGPAHRGDLLQAVTAADCTAQPGKYAAVVAEIERGIHMITGLETIKSAVPGWVGVQCAGEAMAIWLVRAIIVENVMVRREGDVLYLPAGPHFTQKDQIKSIVTVTAKTWHYWIEHMTRQELFKAAETSANKVLQNDPIFPI